MQNGVEDKRGGFAVKGQRPRRHLIKQRTEGEQVGAGVEFLALGLLRRHVRDGSERGAGAGQVGIFKGAGLCAGRSNAAGGAGCDDDLRQAEIHHFGMTALGHEDVGGFDVAMDDAFSMGCVEGVGDLDGEGEDRVQFHRAIADTVLKGQAVEKLHDDKRMPIVPADLVNGTDVGMIECGCGLGLALKAGESLRILGYIVGQKFEGDKAVEVGVFRLVDDTHSSSANFLEHAVVRNSPLNHCGEILGCEEEQVNEDREPRVSNVFFAAPPYFG